MKAMKLAGDDCCTCYQRQEQLFIFAILLKSRKIRKLFAKLLQQKDK